MNSGLLTKIVYHCALLLACFTLAARPQQPVFLTPGENDLVVLNGCVISACNYLAVVKTQHSLESGFWAKILLVRYNNHPAGHAYCVWETDGTIYGYDRNAGSFCQCLGAGLERTRLGPPQRTDGVFPKAKGRLDPGR